jgi:hypothetical protein
MSNLALWQNGYLLSIGSFGSWVESHQVATFLKKKFYFYYSWWAKGHLFCFVNTTLTTRLTLLHTYRSTYPWHGIGMYAMRSPIQNFMWKFGKQQDQACALWFSEARILSIVICKHVHTYAGASALKIYNTTSSLVRFENKYVYFLLCTLKKCSNQLNGGVVVVDYEVIGLALAFNRHTT